MQAIHTVYSSFYIVYIIFCTSRYMYINLFAYYSGHLNETINWGKLRNTLCIFEIYIYSGAQSIQNACQVSLQSSELAPPPPHPLASVYDFMPYPLVQGGGALLLAGGGGGFQTDEGTYTMGIYSTVCTLGTAAQVQSHSRQSDRLFLQSSESGPLHPLTP